MDGGYLVPATLPIVGVLARRYAELPKLDFTRHRVPSLWYSRFSGTPCYLKTLPMFPDNDRCFLPFPGAIHFFPHCPSDQHIHHVEQFTDLLG